MQANLLVCKSKLGRGFFLVSLKILTDINSRSSVCRDHKVFEFVERRCFTGSMGHTMVQHLTSSICVFDLISRERLEKYVGVLSKIDRGYKIRGCGWC